MNTLLLDTNGDLVIGPAGHAVVTGVDKIQQDLRHAILEVYGADPFHPYWGSLISQMVGGFISDEEIALIESEIQRVLQNYIAVQTSQIQSDLLSFDQSRFSTSDVVSSVDSVSVVENPSDPTMVNVTIALSTVSGDTVTVSVGSTL